ncbi:MAG: flagellar hook-length control protein FliK [Thiogranum sp.]|nr:flagellar hook-length control protein FliK [Thiogranum sp.]
MKTSGPTSGIPPTSVNPAPAGTTQWQVGQLLRATVMETNIGKVLLAIGNRQATAQTSLPLQKGQQLTLEVRSLGSQPVLKLVSAGTESLHAAAARTLMPGQGSPAPLLASISQTGRTPKPGLPPPVNRLMREMLHQLPSPAGITSAAGVKKAILNSGIFLETRLLQQAGTQRSGLTLTTDFKANLLRLVQLVRSWPGSSNMAPSRPAAGAGAAASPAAASTQSAKPLPGAAPVQQTRTTPAQVARTLLNLATTAPTSPPGGGILNTSPAGATARSPATLAGTPLPQLPPPLPGNVPVPQAAVVASLDWLNRSGTLRADLLLQVEAALARTQLQQLAAVPREGERGLLEWLLDLPVRRDEAIDLWSLRIFREPQDGRRPPRRHNAGWTVQLAIDLPGLGPMQIHVHLEGEQISTRFWAAQEETLPLLRNHLHELRRALQDAGLEVGELDCQNGVAPAGRSRGREPLISEKV